jgi:hypothetical protein
MNQTHGSLFVIGRLLPLNKALHIYRKELNADEQYTYQSN